MPLLNWRGVTSLFLRGLLLWGSHFVRFSTVFSTLIDSNLFPMVPMLSSAARMPFPGAARAFWECSAEVSHSTQGQSEIVRLDEFSARGSMQKSRGKIEDCCREVSPHRCGDEFVPKGEPWRRRCCSHCPAPVKSPPPLWFKNGNGTNEFDQYSMNIFTYRGGGSQTYREGIMRWLRIWV